MTSFKYFIALSFLFSGISLAAPSQVPLLDVSAPNPPVRRELRGRFLHITDIHPDPHYVTGSSESSACHRKKPKKEKERAGKYGTPYSDCDTPLRLSNLTLDFLEKNWADEIDFVIWTGDNARHDNDRKMPRTLKEIYDLNSVVARRMEEIFLTRGVPVVPSLGNNDIWPHNILMPGPNNIISQFSSIWRNFVPFASYQVFQRGAYYSTEVIPNQVAAISLNTLYFYDSNKAVGGCEYGDWEDPGNLQLDWLEVQLETFRERGMQVYLTGHVPPSRGNYFPECHVRYAELSLRFQDTILGHIYGHMNNDHFFFVEQDDLEFPASLDDLRKAEPLSHDDLYDDLIDDFGGLPKPKKTNYDNYGVVNVSPSVVPNPYLPSFRIFSYNVTQVDQAEELRREKERRRQERDFKHRKEGHDRNGQSRAKLCKKEEYQDSWRCRLQEPWHSDPEAPSRSNTLWTPLGYAQYFIPEKRLLNVTGKPKFKLEYLTYELGALHGTDVVESGKHQYPVPLKQLPKAVRKGKKKGEKYAPYGMSDLTVSSWVGLAQRLGDKEEKKLRKRFRQYMYQW